MSSSMKMALFLIAATVINIVIMLAIFAGILFGGLAIFGPNASGAVIPVFLVAALASVILAFLLYGLIMRKNQPWLEKHVPQLFRKKRQ